MGVCVRRRDTDDQSGSLDGPLLRRRTGRGRQAGREGGRSTGPKEGGPREAGRQGGREVEKRGRKTVLLY